MWKQGLNFGHGLGHGIGVYNCVHEYPHFYMERKHNYSLEAGMTVTNEPGYYREDFYGIRLENILEITGKEKGYLGFDCLTKVPYCKDLIDIPYLKSQY